MNNEEGCNSVNVPEHVAKAVLVKYREDTSGRRVLTSKYPFLLPAVLALRRTFNILKNTVNPHMQTARVRRVATSGETKYLSCVIARHASPLRRKLGESDPALQDGKIQNLKLAIARLDGLIIPPGKVFSFWNSVGAPTAKKGYVNGMLLSEGKVTVGIGGGLCQLSNLLYWLFLHTPVQVLERRHHSRDAFPDSGRTIPFGAGATVFYNLIDLKIKNTSAHPLQLKLWLSEAQLKGQILSTHFLEKNKKFHIKEQNHHFIQTPKSVYRYNELVRETYIEGLLSGEEKITTNCAKVMYEVPTNTISFQISAQQQ